MPYKPMWGSHRRERIWLREKLFAQLNGLGEHPICNLCDEPVTLEQARRDGWHESHDAGRAKTFGGKDVGVAHCACNLKHGREVVTPMAAKANAQRDKHQGRKGPGRGRHPMRAGRRSIETKTFKRGLQRRTTLSEKLAAMRAKRPVGIQHFCGGSSDRASGRPHPLVGDIQTEGAGQTPVPRSTLQPEAPQ